MINLYISKVGLINLKLIPLTEQQKIAQYRSLRKQKESLTGLTLLGQALLDEKISDYEIAHNDCGKPFIVNNPRYFNISHCNEYCIVGLTNTAIGVDIERQSPRLLRVARRFLSKSQLAKHKKEPFSIAYLTKMWTIKEAFLKYIGCGIASSLAKIDVERVDSVEEVFLVSNQTKKAYCKIINYHDYVIAICVKDKQNLKVKIKGERN